MNTAFLWGRIRIVAIVNCLRSEHQFPSLSLSQSPIFLKMITLWGAWCGALSSFQNEVWALPASRGGVNSFSASGWGLQMWLQSWGRKSLWWLLEKVSSLIKYVHSETCPSFVRDRCVSCRHFLKVAILVAFSFVNYLTPLCYLHTFFMGFLIFAAKNHFYIVK